MSGHPFWIPTALSIGRPATSLCLPTIQLSFVPRLTADGFAEAIIKDTRNDMRRAADEMPPGSNVNSRGALNFTLFLDPTFMGCQIFSRYDFIPAEQETL